MKNILAIPLLALALCSCVSEDLAFTVEASPVLGIIEATDAETGTVAYTGTFYRLDKSGILDNNVGIDSIPVAGLELSIETRDRQSLQTAMTDAEGRAVVSLPAADLAGVTRLEWAGSYEGTAFRILKNL